MSKYNGWTNWDTWNTNLWLNNDENTYNQLLTCKSSKEVRLLFLDVFCSNGENTHDDIDFGCVDWYEIFNSIEVS